MRGLKKGDAQRQVDAHDPVLGVTGEESIEDISNHTQDPVDVESSDGADCQRNVSDAKVRELSVANEESCCRQQETSPCDDDANVRDAESIQVESESHIVAIGIGRWRTRCAMIETINISRLGARTWNRRGVHPYQRVASSVGICN